MKEREGPAWLPDVFLNAFYQPFGYTHCVPQWHQVVVGSGRFMMFVNDWKNVKTEFFEGFRVTCGSISACHLHRQMQLISTL